MKASTFFVGLVSGVVAGSAAVLFSTPQSGSDLRSNVKTASSDWKEKLSEVKFQISDLKQSIAGLTKTAKTDVPQTINELKQSVQQWQSETAPIQESLQNEIASIQLAMEELEKSIAKHQKDSSPANS
ncbi:YtxH domain-containing protein [Paenisporosarcina quisquiliarum]|uniref:YtxH domain-containing protein n=1 Tax=Paenisporosarcina quisquiliarum TaxID=365346 RepID=A0A9X3LL35_9BACL|nr:YtxH domain-containing protein [Paenisporosarcina quisquiliarum]MCZ8538444.1 YtxH domain-containing protein [Paenisporosarcina quisquiliarum]